jgi:hypothetical protein
MKRRSGEGTDPRGKVRLQQIGSESWPLKKQHTGADTAALARASFSFKAEHEPQLSAAAGEVLTIVDATAQTIGRGRRLRSGGPSREIPLKFGSSTAKSMITATWLRRHEREMP